MPPFSINQQITFLYTSDLEMTAQFYENVLELELALDQDSCRIYRTSCNSFLGFCQRTGVQPNHPDVVLTMVTEDVDGIYAVLAERGVKFVSPPTFNPKFNIYHCYLQDPNGYLLEIQRFEDSRWSDAD